MFEVGFSELVVIFGLALVVLGPGKLPRLVSQVGRWIGRARAMARQFREQLEAEADRHVSELDPHININDPFTSSSVTPPKPPEPEPPADERKP